MSYSLTSHQRIRLKQLKGSRSGRLRFVGEGIVGYGRYMKYKQYLSTITHNQIVQERLEIIKFFDRYGAEAAREAYGYSRSTIYLWKKRYREAGYNPQSLIPKSRRPKRTRRMEVGIEVIEFIKDLRKRYPYLGKAKIKSLLDEYCRESSLTTISESTIGKVIKRYNLYYPKTYGKIYHNPASGHASRKKRKRKRISSRVRAKSPGEIVQIDTIVRFEYGLKRYIITAIDLYSRFSFALTYKSLSSKMALDFYKRLEKTAPFEIKGVKTDNGLEFLGDFDKYLEKQGVTHYFSYPRTPQSNAYVERFNRTIQEEFVNFNLEFIEDTQEFNDKLIDYLIFFNTVRPHQALKFLTPMGYLIANQLVSNMCATRT